MATDPGTIDLLFDQLGPRARRYATKRMFGEYCLYFDGAPIALVCDDVLYVKDTPDGRAAIGQATEPVFGPPYPGAKPHLRLPADLWDDGDWLHGVLEHTAGALPPPKPRKPRASAKASVTPGTPAAKKKPSQGRSRP
jgi:TfoX/Sxy family transcriptional regulator of competence genes